jgi:hypothetical protein
MPLAAAAPVTTIVRMADEAALVAGVMADTAAGSAAAPAGASGSAAAAADAAAAAAAAAASALEHNIKTKGSNAYYYAHASNLGGKELRAYHEPVSRVGARGDAAATWRPWYQVWPPVEKGVWPRQRPRQQPCAFASARAIATSGAGLQPP